MTEAPGVLITRPDPDGAALAAVLAARGWRPVACPLLRFVPLTAAIDPTGIAALVFTSANGVRAAPADAALHALPVWAVGEATAQAARDAGFRSVRAGPSDAAALAHAILADPPSRGSRLLHLRGRHGAPGLAQALAAGGLHLTEVPIYRMDAAEALPPEAVQALNARRLRAVPVYSPRTGRVLTALTAGRFDLGAVTAVAISPAAAAPLAGAGFAAVRTAARPDGKAMLAALDALRAEVAA